MYRYTATGQLEVIKKNYLLEGFKEQQIPTIEIKQDFIILETGVDLNIIEDDFKNLNKTCDISLKLIDNIIRNEFNIDGNLIIERYKNSLISIENLITDTNMLEQFKKQYNFYNHKTKFKCILNTFNNYIPNTSELKTLTENLIFKIDNLKEKDEHKNVVKRYCINNKCLTKEEINNLYDYINL